MGKGILIYIVGLSMLIGYSMINVNSAGTNAMDNYMRYYGGTMARNIAASGANIGCSDVFINQNYNTPYVDVPFMGGKMNVRFVEAGNKKFVISDGSIRIGARTVRDTIIAELRNDPLSRFAWFTNIEANKGGQPSTWSSGDTAWGPAHTNDKFNINGSPVFMKKATAWRKAVPTKNSAKWNGGYEWAIKIDYPTNLNGFVGAAQQASGRVVNNKDAHVTFNAGGTVRLRVPADSFDSTFSSASALTSNGALCVIGANLYVSGTVSGDLAVGAVTGGGGGGNVYITGNVVYATNPLTNPSATNKLGIYAEKDIQVTYDNSSPASYYNRRVEASVFSLTGVFEVQDAKLYPPRGTLYTLGAMMQYRRGEIGEVNPGSGALLNGYYKNFRYDERLASSPPKYYPASGRYLLFAWREG